MSLTDLGELERATDAELTVRLRSGDRAAFAEFHRRYRECLLRYCTCRLGRDAEVEDVAQEAWSRAWRSRGSFEGACFYPWLRAVAGNLCTDLVRRKVRSRALPAPDVQTAPSSEEHLMESVQRELLDQALARLNERHRRTLDMREREGWSYERIAAADNVNVGAVAAVLTRARRALRREYLALAGEDAGCWSAIPLLGWLARRLREARMHMGASPVVQQGLGVLVSPLVAVAVAAVAGLAAGGGTQLVAAGGRPAGPGGPSVLLAVTGRSLPSASSPTAAPPGPALPVPAPASAAETPLAASAPSSLSILTAGVARTRATGDPLYASAGGLTVGVDPTVAERVLSGPSRALVGNSPSHVLASIGGVSKR